MMQKSYQESKDRGDTKPKGLSTYDVSKALTALKKQEAYAWLNEAPAICLVHSLQNLDKAFKNFYRNIKQGNPGGLKFKSKHKSRKAFSFHQGYTLQNGQIQMPKTSGWVKFKMHRPFEGVPKTITVFQEPTGKFYISIVAHTPETPPEKRTIHADSAVGIDLGIKDFAITSDGEIFTNQQHLRTQLRRLKRANKKLSRRFKKGAKEQSKNYYKQKIKVARLYEKTRFQRDNYTGEISAQLLKEYDTVFIEDLNIKGMVKNKKLSRAISDMGWGQFVSKLEAKAEQTGKNVIKVNRYFPSSKTCSGCGHIKNDLELKDRSWECKNCGAYHDRDINAAKNIKQKGLETVKTKQLQELQCERA